MKKIVAIGLLILLLYNMLGLTTAVLLFDNQYKSAASSSHGDDYQLLKVYVPSLPYTTSWENDEEIEGLTKSNGNFYNTTHVLHTNDTLYITLKSNQPARDRFFELANQMQSMTDPGNTPDSSHGKALKLLDNFIKNYVQNIYQFSIHHQLSSPGDVIAIYPSKEVKPTRFLIKLQTPPPEQC
ncbi:hypothetical protein ACFP1I_31465 [Dyadobacter subterraneus]|uniref:Uncharacterized protein n=1 Tax=Dyadobacter subterraneus TaxID=2773304 RepID=A0ABR9W8R2_9BACT|nr:hypothetical protein [Dyadobacter subterraneus]MBE9461840.1 hypothetical protein [Dyadobacter subterraneus]